MGHKLSVASLIKLGEFSRLFLLFDIYMELIQRMKTKEMWRQVKEIMTARIERIEEIHEKTEGLESNQIKDALSAEG